MKPHVHLFLHMNRSDPKRLADALDTETEESCTTYNMLKVYCLN